ncbi:COTL1 (predicted) [Pycnogonum litorale]
MSVVEKYHEEIKSSYQDVRSDSSETNWAVYKYEGNSLMPHSTGVGFGEFKDCFNDDERLFGYYRIDGGDELSKRKKFLFVTWLGENVSPLKKAKISTDKPFVKNIITNFGVEIFIDNKVDLDEEKFKILVNKAGGSNYGTAK